MQFRRMLPAMMLTAAMAGAAFAQTDKHAHHHDSAKAAESKASTDAAKPQIAAKELKQRLDNGERIVVIDARHELGGQILKGAIHVPMDRLEAWAKDVDKKTVIVTYCTCPHDEAADAEVKTLRQMGFSDAYALSGGLDAARAAGLEVVAPSEK
jgi:rhodanese-related sulfurtransferase